MSNAINVIVNVFYLPKGIHKEPQFQSKKRAPLNPPQVSTSLQWGAPGVLARRQTTTRPISPPAEVSEQAGSVENVETPLAPRTSKPTRASKTTPVQKVSSSGHLPKASADQETQKQPADGVSTILTCSLAERWESIIISYLH